MVKPRPDRASWSVVVVRSGGFAGLRREWRASSDDDVDVNVDWAALVKACPWNSRTPPARGADEFVWRITASGPPRTCEATLSDQALTGPWRDLVVAVQSVHAQRRAAREG
jgi:hypothetical protein